MLEFLRHLLGTDFMPHAYCIGQSDVIWLHVISDAIIALSYYSIPITLFYFVRNRKDLAFHWIFLMFGIFILACGTTHLLAIYILWTPMYRLEGVVKLITALFSVGTAIALVRIVPKALTLPRPSEMAATNDALAREVAERRTVEAEIRRLNEELEARVAERTAALTQSNQDLQQFAYIASHDLQEPLRMIAGYTRLLQRRYRGRLDEDADEFIGFAVDGANRMQAMIQDLLSYSSIDSRPVPDEIVDLNSVVRDAIANLQASVQETNAEITAEPLPTLTGDYRQLVRLFQNLIGNSLKYRSEKKPVVTVSAKLVGPIIEISVADNGIGIDPQYCEQIFVLFKRLHGWQYPGTGIGLSVCHKIVQWHRGSIRVESALGAGSTFIVCFPIPNER